MFNNVGKKLKGLAPFVCWVRILVCVIIGLGYITKGTGMSDLYPQPDASMVIIGIVVILLGFLVSWVKSLVIYGIGKLVDDRDRLVAMNGQETLDNYKSAKVESEKKEVTENDPS